MFIPLAQGGFTKAQRDPAHRSEDDVAPVAGCLTARSTRHLDATSRDLTPPASTPSPISFYVSPPPCPFSTSAAPSTQRPPALAGGPLALLHAATAAA